MKPNSKPAKVTFVLEDSPYGVLTRVHFDPPCDQDAPKSLTPAQSVGVNVLGHLMQNHYSKVVDFEEPSY
jgi:hypothetical protein